MEKNWIFFLLWRNGNQESRSGMEANKSNQLDYATCLSRADDLSAR